MKLRITNNHITYRIDQDEAQILLSKKTIFETLILPNKQTFIYMIEAGNQDKMSIVYNDHCLKLKTPISALKKLMTMPLKEGVTEQYSVNDHDVSFSLQIDLKQS